VIDSRVRQSEGMFLDAAARGDVRRVSELLRGAPSLINRSGRSGWTALMLAARNGHYEAAEALLSHGCDRLSVNGSSQSALDVARFWGHRHIAALLAGAEGVPPTSDLHPRENYFSRETLDRLSAKRTDAVWLEERRSQPDSVYLLFSDLSPMVSPQVETKLCRLGYEAVKDLLQKPATVLIFLGVERRKQPSSSPSSSSSSPAWFAINTEEDAGELLKRFGQKKCCFTKTANRDLLKLSEDEAGEEQADRS
uniref:Uncharacterized protein n=1 Tax=Gasterosteus aculeatus aculeatus TaxID=481459 RepID=A0AAQ4RSY1_GASAC